jgi:uncharacterized membrane protein YkgB
MKKLSNNKRKCTLCAVLRWLTLIVVISIFIGFIRVISNEFFPYYAENIIIFVSFLCGALYWYFYGY